MARAEGPAAILGCMPNSEGSLGVRCSKRLVGRLCCVNSDFNAAREAGGSESPGRYALPAADLSKNSFYAIAPDKLWTPDITYVGTREGFVYLAFILDIYSRRVADPGVWLTALGRSSWWMVWGIWLYGGERPMLD